MAPGDLVMMHGEMSYQHGTPMCPSPSGVPFETFPSGRSNTDRVNAPKHAYVHTALGGTCGMMGCGQRGARVSPDLQGSGSQTS
jgi:hypothetical protein